MHEDEGDRDEGAVRDEQRRDDERGRCSVPGAGYDARDQQRIEGDLRIRDDRQYPVATAANEEPCGLVTRRAGQDGEHRHRNAGPFLHRVDRQGTEQRSCGHVG